MIRLKYFKFTLGYFASRYFYIMADYIDKEDVQIVVDAKRSPIEPVEYSYTERDVMLYNLGIGATEKELQWTYEGDDQFAALPTFGVIPQFHASGSVPLDFLPSYNPVRDLDSLSVLPFLCFCLGQVASWRTISCHQGSHSRTS